MTDKERLESLKRNKKWTEATGEKFYAVHKKDYKWLIKQAERARELEAENRMLRTVAESNKYIGEQCLEQNKRYRELINQIKNNIPLEFNLSSEYEAKKNVISLINIDNLVNEYLEGEE